MLHAHCLGYLASVCYVVVVVVVVVVVFVVVVQGSRFHNMYFLVRRVAAEVWSQ